MKGNSDANSTRLIIGTSALREHHAQTVLLQLQAAASAADPYGIHELVAVEHQQHVVAKVRAGCVQAHKRHIAETRRPRKCRTDDYTAMKLLRIIDLKRRKRRPG